MSTELTGVGIIGCGNIFKQYGRGIQYFKGLLDLRAVADLDVERAKATATEWNVPKAGTPEELLSDPDIQIVINLTVPQAHAPVDLQIIEAGKHPYSEKPLAVERADAKQVLEAANAEGLRVGCAPDTFLGGGIQTCIKLIDDGWIGTPVAATAFMMSAGPESWHPNPSFFYLKGGGPMFDMGPYYLTSLVALLGPVRRITGSARITREERTATAESTYGQKLKVETPTHVAAVLDFHSGPVATLVTSFDVQAADLPRIEIYGTEGTLSVPDPNTFGGPVKFNRSRSDEWMEIPVLHQSVEPGRGTGVADMAAAIQQNRPHRASGELAYHVLDLMYGVHDASSEGRHIDVQSTCKRPMPLSTKPVREAVLN